MKKQSRIIKNRKERRKEQYKPQPLEVRNITQFVSAGVFIGGLLFNIFKAVAGRSDDSKPENQMCEDAEFTIVEPKQIENVTTCNNSKNSIHD